jgi:hypothetical protein
MDKRQWTLSVDPKPLGTEPTARTRIHVQCYVSQTVGKDRDRIKMRRDRNRTDLKKWDRDSKK